VSEASGNQSLPSGMERKLLIRPLPAELFSETMLQLGGGNDVDLGDYIEENYLSDWRVVSHTIDFRPEGSHLLTVLVERPANTANIRISNVGAISSPPLPRGSRP
jgi:hypothetical protein